MSEKPILINGFARSGTTFLYFQMRKHYGNRVLYEPLNINTGLYIRLAIKDIHPYKNTHTYLSDEKIKELYKPYYDIFGEKIFEIIAKYHPRSSYGVPMELIRKYLEHFKGFHIKEIYLSYHLSDEFIKENWDVYHIIRHPGDVFISITERSGVNYDRYKRITKLTKIPLVGKYIRTIFSYWIENLLSNMFGLYGLARHLHYLYGPVEWFDMYNIEKLFVFTWTIINYIAIRSLPSDKIIIYNKPKTFNKLPFNIQEEEIKIKEYPERYKLLDKFEKIADELNLLNEFEYLTKLFYV